MSQVEIRDNQVDLKIRCEKLEKLLGLKERWRLPVHLSPIQHAIFGLLFKAKTSLNPEQISEAVYRGRPDSKWPQAKTAEVHICNIRKIIAPLEITIETDWGVGYYISEEMRAKIKSIMLYPPE